MHINSSTFFLGFLHELNHIIEAAFDVFSHVVFQVQRQVLESLVNVVVSAVVCSTIHDMSNTILFEQVVVLGNNVAAQVQEVI